MSDTQSPLKIVFYGEDVEAFIPGFAEQLRRPAEIAQLPIRLQTDAQRGVFAAAQAIVSNRFPADAPMPANLRLLHVPAAGTDQVAMDAVPAAATVCNSFGHEQAISEYVLAALLARCVPLADADARLRRGDWKYQAGDPARVHAEMSELTLGLYGFGHIGKLIAIRAKAFGLRVVVANRSPVAVSETVDRAFALDDLAFWGAADAIVVSLPFNDSTRGIVGTSQLGAMRQGAVIFNVGRGPVIDERALFDALTSGRIDGVIDTWYVYPSPDAPNPVPGNLAFHTLPNLVMTPHMSGWTRGTIHRRRDLAARNINRIGTSEAFENVVRPPRS